MGSDNKIAQLVLSALENNNTGIIITNENDIITYINSTAHNWTGLSANEKLSSEIIQNTQIFSMEGEYLEVQKECNYTKSCVYLIQSKPNPDEMILASQSDYERLFRSLYDDIFISNSDGYVMNAQGFSEIAWGQYGEKVIGRHIEEVEKEGYFYPSATLKVLQSKKTETVLQHDRFSGEKFVCQAVPLLDDNGDIEKIIAVSQLVTDQTALNSRLNTVTKLMEVYKTRLSEIIESTNTDYRYIGSSIDTKEIRKMIKKTAAVQSTVLIFGESGTGKEVIARNIHMLSERNGKPFVKINCGAIPENLLESELFGYVKGAFTGALDNGKIGLFEQANGGTLFLDEIGDMPLQLQVKLLEVLQDRVVKKIGSTTEIPVDVRIIAATHQNLEKMIKEKTFRLDLFYRLNVLSINATPLRNRREDINDLTAHFLNIYDSLFNKTVRMSKDAMKVLINHDWPGNVRQLANVIEKIVVLSESELVEPDDVKTALSFSFSVMENKSSDKSPIEVKDIIPWNEARELLANELIWKAYTEFKTTTAAADALGINQSTVARRIKKIKESRNVDNI